MKRRMEQLINGRFEYEVPALVLSAREISGEVIQGETFRGEFGVGAEDNRRIKGMVMSSSRRVMVGKEKFSGNAVSIPLCGECQRTGGGGRDFGDHHHQQQSGRVSAAGPGAGDGGGDSYLPGNRPHPG